MSRSPRPNQVGSTPYAASSSLVFHVSPLRPQPRSVSIPPPRVYITVSRSGHTLRPCSQMSSAVLAITVTSVSALEAARRCNKPSTKRAPPTPPDSTVTLEGDNDVGVGMRGTLTAIARLGQLPSIARLGQLR